MSNLARFQLGESLHQGDRHDVVRATSPDGQPVVLKILRALHPSPERIARFRHEFDTLAAVDSPHVVGAVGFVTDQRRWALVQEDCGGSSLAEHLSDEALGFAERLDIAVAVATAVADVHAQGLMHKDINPSNVVRNPSTGAIQLIDFGLATALASERPAFSNRNRLEGTLRYISPEQTGRVTAPVDSRSDLYSLGVTLYELFVGRLPFETDDAVGLVHAHIARQPPVPADVRPDLPSVLSDLILRLLSKSVEDRYQSAHGLLADLKRCRSGLRDGVISGFELGGDDVSDQLRIPAKLYGREAEAKQLSDALDLASGEVGASAVFVRGAAGMGKTALVESLYGALTERRGYYIAGKFEQIRRTPFSALVAAFQGLVTELLTENEERIARLRNDLLVALGPHGRLIIDVIPQVELITGPQPAVEELGAAETLNRFAAVFRRFVRVFARPDHPVVLFLDDLQWADTASLNLLRALATDDEQSLLILGAFRDSEVDGSHPLTATFKGLADDGCTTVQLDLGPLTEAHIAELLADTLGASEGVEAMAALVTRNTGGNPLFVRELVRSLGRDGLLRFEHSERRWSWDLAELRARGFTQSVLDLMTDRLSQLEPNTLEALRVAACAGATFDLPTVARLRGETVAQLWTLLRPAVQEGVLVATSELDVLIADEDSPHQRCSFFHDRLQQATYEAMDADQRTRTHLRIGRLLRDDPSADPFEVVFQLNEGRRFIDYPAERLSLAQLNLDAGRRAASTAAHDTAVRCFDVGVDLLPEDAWSSQYELAMELRRGGAEALHVLAERERSDSLIKACIEHARTDLERAELHVVDVRQHTASGRYPEALEASRRGLALLDFELVADGYMEVMLASFGELQAQMAGRKAAEFLERAPMSDPVAIAKCRLLSWTMAPAFYIDPLLYSVISFEAMKLLVEHGNPPDALAIYAQYGHLLGAMFGDPPGGYEFTKLSIELAERQGSLADVAESCFLSANFSLGWVRPFQEARAVIDRGIEAGLQSGDLRFTTYNFFYSGLNSLLLGEPLDGILRDNADHLAFAQRQRETIGEDACRSVRLVLRNLAGRTDGLDFFADEDLDEAAYVARMQANGSIMVLCYFRVLQCGALVAHGDIAGALEASAAALEIIATIPGNICVGRLAFSTGLALAAALRERDDDGQREQLDATLEQLAGYVTHCEANWGHTHALVAAERARTDGDGPAAIEAYERAIALAQAHGWASDHALACELAGRYWMAEGRDELGRTYLAQARYGYEQWGCAPKVASLDTEFDDLAEGAAQTRSLSSLRSVSVTSTETSSGALDLAAVMQAAQALSGELALEGLLGRLLQLVLENAGAQHGVLVVADGAELAVRAAASLEPDDSGGQALHADVALNVSLSSYDAVSAAMVRYVARTNDSVVLDDASSVGAYTRDPRVLKSRARSILCLPLRSQGELFGALYLENAAVLGAFTTDRLEVVNLLASQFSVSFENARLYQEMEAKVARRTEQLASKNQQLEETLDDLRVAQDQLVASNAFIRKTFGRYVSDDVVQHLLAAPEALELGGERRPITVLASDVRGFTSLAERLEPEEVITLLNRYFEAMFRVIHRHGGTINAILGDGLFVFFGAPIAQPDAPRKAVACALDMMLEMERIKGDVGGELAELEMGIGVHSGAAVVGNIGSQDRTKYSAIGLDVNLAARIEGCTVGGQILISAATADALRPDVVLSNSMEFSAKGVERPLTLYEVEGLGGDSTVTYRRLRSVLAPISGRIELRFNVVSGGVVAPTQHIGALVSASADEGELVTDAPLAPLTDLKIQIFDGGERVAGDLYGKVLSGDGGRTRLGFTAVPPRVREFLAKQAEIG
jgi:predicted ATPase/class 3 adenylate cyclase